MRPHVELVHHEDLIWHNAELPFSEGRAVQRNLSYDEENGAASTLVRFREAWQRPPGFHSADTEWFVLSGAVSVGSQRFGKGAYLRAPAGLAMPAMEAEEGTEVLLFREYGDFGFSRSDHDWSEPVRLGGNTVSDERGTLTLVSTEQRPWEPNIYEGDSQRFLHLKMLFRDPSPPDDHTKGFVTILAWAPPGWTDHKVAHHPCFEEAYCLRGDMDYNFGQISPGSYFFRPARVKHGMFRAGWAEGATWLFRLDGDLINWVTENPEVSVSGRARNYDPSDERQRPVLAGLPVRSRRIGAWDGRGR
jgi:hypothetical protein